MGYSPGPPTHQHSQRLKDAVRACKLGTKCSGPNPNSSWFDLRERRVLCTAHRSARSDARNAVDFQVTPEWDGPQTAADPTECRWERKSL